MQNHYEAVFILTPVLSEYQVKETVDKFKKVLTDNKAEIVHEENWGLKKLAYNIKNKTTGYYQLLEFKVAPEVINKFETQFRRDEKVIRFLTFRQDKNSIVYNERRRNKNKNVKEVVNETENKEEKQTQTNKKEK